MEITARHLLVAKILEKHPNTDGIGIKGRVSCTSCGRAFNYYVEDGRITGECVRDGCLELFQVSKFEMEIEKIKNLVKD